MKLRATKFEMKIIKCCLTWVLALHICFLPMALSQARQAQLLLTGIFHGDEVAAESGEKWLALVPFGNGYALKETRLGIEFVKDEIIDEDGEATAKKVFIDLDKKPLFLVRGLPGIAAGPVETAVAEPLYLKIGNETPFKLNNDRRYALRVACDENSPLTVDHFGKCPLILKAQPKTQNIHDFQIYRPPGTKPVFAGDARPALIWAGDLNTDGALDLLIDVSNQYNTSALTLFLSSGPTSEALVIKAAAFITSGC